jgi:RNA polymerase sigma-70 factor (ECF subfamily)
MLDDTLLIWKFKAGDSASLGRIYDKYRRPLLLIAAGLLTQTEAAEDVVHDLFLWLARSPEKVRLRGNLRSFLATCVANRARNANKAARVRVAARLDEAEPLACERPRPERWLIANEQMQRLNEALAELPYEQREAVVLHLQGGMTFREIAQGQDASINTVQSRYRYGLEKLRSQLNGEV